MQYETFEHLDASDAVIVRWNANRASGLHALEGALDRLIEQRPGLVVVDLSGANFLSGAAMRLLVQFRRGLAAQGGVVKLAAPGALALDALQRTRLADLFEICDTVEDALASEPVMAV